MESPNQLSLLDVFFSKKILSKEGIACIFLGFALGCSLTWMLLYLADTGISKETLHTKEAATTDFIALSLNLINQKKYAEAATACQKGLALNPNDTILHNNLAVAYLQMGSAAKAEIHLNQALSIAPNYQLAKNNLAWAQSMRGDILKDIAIKKDKAQFAKDAATKVSTLIAVAILHARLDEFQTVVGIYDNVLQLDPRNAIALNNSGVAYMALNQSAKALDLFRQANQLYPQEPLYQNNMKWALDTRDTN